MGDAQSTGQMISEVREARGIGQSDLAECLDVDVSVISDIENGDKTITVDELAMLAGAMGVSPLGILDPGSLPGRLARYKK